MHAELGGEEERLERFRQRSDASTARLAELKEVFAQKRKAYIASGVLPDPARPGSLEDASKLVGTCAEMCPEYERLEREIQKELDRLEVYPGTLKANPAAAVKIYRRPAAGRELPLPEEVRPADVLRKTLDYLFHELLPADPGDAQFAHVQPFLWNRTRAVRQDFIVQSDTGRVSIECHERIARYHILCLHWKGGRGAESWSEQQELEQLRKTLRSLIEYYDDQRMAGHACPNEPEFRAYNLMMHARDPETLREVELLPTPVFRAGPIQLAVELRGLIQRSNLLEKRGNPRNTEATLNFYTKFFALLRTDRVPYLVACLAENLFPSVRIGAVKAMMRAYMQQHMGLPIAFVASVLGMDTHEQCRAFLESLGVEVEHVQGTDVAKINKATVLDEDKSFVAPFSEWVEEKRGGLPCQAIIDGGEARKGAHGGGAAAPERPVAPMPKLALPQRSMADKAAAPPFVASSAFAPPAARAPAPTTAPTPAFSFAPAPPAPARAPAKAPAPARAPAPAPTVPPAAPIRAPAPPLDKAPPPASSAFAPPAPASASASASASAPAPRATHPAPAPPRPKVPRAQLAQGLASHLCTDAATQATHDIARDALAAEHRRRRHAQRASLVDRLAHALEQRLEQEPVDDAVRAAAHDAAARTFHRRAVLRRACARWRAALAAAQDRAVQAARLRDIRERLQTLHASEQPVIQPRRLFETPKRRAFDTPKLPRAFETPELPRAFETPRRPLSPLDTPEPRSHLSDRALQTVYSAAARQRERLWQRGTFADLLLQHFVVLSEDAPPPPGATYTVSLCLPAPSAATLWLRNKLDLDDDECLYDVHDASVALAASVRPDTGLLLFACSEAQLADAARMRQVQGRVRERPRLLLIAWTRMQVHVVCRVLDRRAWAQVNVMLLDDAACDADEAFAYAIHGLVPAIAWHEESTPALRPAIAPLYDVWRATVEAIAKLDGAPAFAMATALTNLFLRQVAAGSGTDEVQLALPDASPYTPLAAALHQLDALPWSENSATRLLRAQLIEAPLFSVAWYLEQVVAEALARLGDTPCVIEARDMAQLEALGQQALAELAHTRPTRKRPASDVPVTPVKRVALPSTPKPKAAVRTESLDRLRKLMASTATLLRSPP